MIDEASVIPLATLPDLIPTLVCVGLHDVDALEPLCHEPDELADGGSAVELAARDQPVVLAVLGPEDLDGDGRHVRAAVQVWEAAAVVRRRVVGLSL